MSMTHVSSEIGATRLNSCTSYVIDDQTAIKVVDNTVEVISEGQWRLFTPDTDRQDH